ncbi:MAG: exodeoxyribonuclease I [Desulfobacterales bacterium]|nr:exodeoxyribonuclease I [Desulfobacterales bacterium]
MKKTYLFYDIETTGLNKAFDQVLRFAAIRTDRQLNEIERYTIKIQLRPDVIPSPGAIITNRLSIEDLTNGLHEFEAIRQIHQIMNTPDTIGLGYNTLGFDDEFLRFSFHRNLLPPYTHQYRHGCRRMDLLPMAVMFWLYRKEVITWPQINGKPSLKLEHLRETNQLTAGPSHDAAVDVGATMELTRRFIRDRQMWDYLLGYFEKETDAHRVDEIPNSFQSALGEHRKGLMVSSEYGPQLMYQVPVLSIGNSIPYSNQTLWLRLDLPALKETKANTIDDSTWIVRKRYGEPGIILPPHQRYWKFLSAERKTIVSENLKWLQSNPAIFQQIVSYHRDYSYPFIPNLDPEAALYQIGFFTRSDEKLFKEFQTAQIEEKERIINRLSSEDARTLAKRLLCRNYPKNLPENITEEFEAYLRRLNPLHEDEAIVDYKGEPRLTPSVALAEIKRLKKSARLDNHQGELLDDLKKYIKINFPKNKAGRQLSIGDRFCD